MDIGGISNYYGGVVIFQNEDNNYYWGIEDWDASIDVEQIPQYLYEALLRYEQERQERNK